jgi:hypothetical protein
MANHVYSYWSLRQANDEAKAYFKEFTTHVNNSAEENDNFLMVEFLYQERRPEDESEHWQWFIDRVGSKWITIEDVYDEELSMTTAWDSPDSLFERLVENLKVIDPNVQLVMTYEDEMPNFVGVWYYNGENDDLDCEHYACENFQDLLGTDMELEDEELAEKYELDASDEDAIWEKRSELRDDFWELWGNEQTRVIQEAMTKWEDDPIEDMIVN